MKAYYGSRENFESIVSWEQMRPPYLEKNLEKARKSGQVTDLPKGWDDRKSIYELTDDEIRAAAAFRGGKFIGPVEEVRTDASGINQYAVIVPETDLDNLKQVFVIKEFNIVE